MQSPLLTQTQQPATYSWDEHEAWRQLYSRQAELLANRAASACLRGLALSGITPNALPRFEAINAALAQQTGWQVVPAEGLVPDDAFFALLAERKFPATTFIRPLDSLDYIEAPDMFHDVFGHVPMLTNPAFTAFLQGVGELGLRYADNAEAIHILSRLYWFTVEFGLIEEDGRRLLYGAGLMSSPGEAVYSVESEEPTRHAFELETVLGMTYRKDVFQTRYVVIPGFEALYEALPRLDTAVRNALAA